MSGQHGKATLDRLLAVKWADEEAFDHRSARLRLMGEYLRRAAWWAQHFGPPERWPFYDIAEQVVPDVQIPEELSLPLEELLTSRVGWPEVAITCRGAVRWAAAVDAGRRPAEGEDPYEPLLLFFERGGLFTRESGFIEVYGGSVLPGTWADNLSRKPADISAAALEALDEADA